MYRIFVSSVILLVLDTIFLYLNSRLFSQQITEVQRSPLKLNYIGAIFTYLLLIFAVNYFVLIPGKGILDAFLLGVVIYGVYEGTSWAVLKNWKPLTVVMDTLWGGALLAATTFLTYGFLKATK